MVNHGEDCFESQIRRLLQRVISYLLVTVQVRPVVIELVAFEGKLVVIAFIIIMLVLGSPSFACL